MTFQVVIEFDPATAAYSAVCPELPGCVSAGDTEAQARTNIEHAIRTFLETAVTSAGKDEAPYDPDAPSIETVLAGLANEVPPGEWNKLPADLTDHLDHYIYGTPKR